VQLPPLEERIRLLQEEENELHSKNLFDDKYHYLGGDSQWDYCRTLAKLVIPGFAEVENNSDEGFQSEGHRMAAYIDMLQAIYNDNNKRRPFFTGGLDSYRSRRYRINWYILQYYN